MVRRGGGVMLTLLPLCFLSWLPAARSLFFDSILFFASSLTDGCFPQAPRYSISLFLPNKEKSTMAPHLSKSLYINTSSSLHDHIILSVFTQTPQDCNKVPGDVVSVNGHVFVRYHFSNITACMLHQSRCWSQFPVQQSQQK